VSNDEFGVVRPILLLVGGANSYDAGPVSLPFRDGVEEGGGPLDKAEKKKNNLFEVYFKNYYLRVPVLLSDLSESICSVLCGFKENDESKSVDDESPNSSNFRLCVLLFVCTDCLDEYTSEN